MSVAAPPNLQREDSSCQLGAVQTWPVAAALLGDSGGSFWVKSGHCHLTVARQLMTRSGDIIGLYCEIFIQLIKQSTKAVV
jgi:hypothetical protein